MAEPVQPVAKLTPDSRVANRVENRSALIMGEDAKSRAYVHAFLAQVCLPYRAVTGQFYRRKTGDIELTIQGGVGRDPVTRDLVVHGVPYGAKPRLLMLHLCTQAVKVQSPVVQVGDSMSAFMLDCGLDVTGGRNGSIARFKDQLARLSAARMTFFRTENSAAGSRDITINPAPIIHRVDAWYPADPRQRMLWESELTLSADFYEGLIHHALPLDPRAYGALAHSARALDLYTWLAHRLTNVTERGGVFLHWGILKAQFGPDARDMRQFKREMLNALAEVLAVYPKARVTHEHGKDDSGRDVGGLRLRRSDPPIALKSGKRRARLAAT